jgi:hypothetical protein
LTAAVVRHNARRVKPTDALFDGLKDWLAATNPGLVRREDLTQLEAQLDELLEMVAAIEERLALKSAPTTKPE